MNPDKATTPDLEIDPFTGKLRRKFEMKSQSLVYTPLNRNLLYTKAEVDALLASSNAADVDSVNGRTGAVVLTSSDVNLGNVDNTSDSAKNSATATLTNKRITPRVGTTTSSATPTINTDSVDAYSITAQGAAITSFTTNLSGTPADFQRLTIRIKDDGTARAITWGASFEAKGVALPTTTVISKVLTVGFIYDIVTAKWGCVASAQEA